MCFNILLYFALYITYISHIFILLWVFFFAFIDLIFMSGWGIGVFMQSALGGGVSITTDPLIYSSVNESGRDIFNN